MNKQSGFGLVGVLIIIPVVGLISFAGWSVWKSSSQSNTKTSVKPVTDTTKEVVKVEDKKAEAPEGFTLYQNEEIGFSFYYPEYWGVLAEKSDATSGLDLEGPNVPMNEHDDIKLFVWADKAENFVSRSTNKNFTYTPSAEDNGVVWKHATTAYGIPAGTVAEHGPKLVDAISNTKIYGLQGGHSCRDDKQYLFQLDDTFIGIKVDFSGCFDAFKSETSPEKLVEYEKAYNQAKEEIEKIPASIKIQ